jgi:hypothetical protein
MCLNGFLSLYVSKLSSVARLAGSAFSRSGTFSRNSFRLQVKGTGQMVKCRFRGKAKLPLSRGRRDDPGSDGGSPSHERGRTGNCGRPLPAIPLSGVNPLRQISHCPAGHPGNLRRPRSPWRINKAHRASQRSTDSRFETSHDNWL